MTLPPYASPGFPIRPTRAYALSTMMSSLSLPLSLNRFAVFSMALFSSSEFESVMIACTAPSEYAVVVESMESTTTSPPLSRQARRMASSKPTTLFSRWHCSSFVNTFTCVAAAAAATCGAHSFRRRSFRSGARIFCALTPSVRRKSHTTSALAIDPFSTAPGPRGSSTSTSARRMLSKRLLICRPVERTRGVSPHQSTIVAR